MTPNEEYWKFGESERHFNEIQAGIRMESRFTISTRCDSILDWFAHPEVRPRLPI